MDMNILHLNTSVAQDWKNQTFNFLYLCIIVLCTNKSKTCEMTELEISYNIKKNKYSYFNI